MASLGTGTSNTGIGTLLSQTNDGCEHVVAYASRTLSISEHWYCIAQKELLAIACHCGLHQALLIISTQTTIYVIHVCTDDDSLRWLRSFKEPEGQPTPWIEQLQEYDFKAVQCRGVSHCNGDALSFLTCPQCSQESHLEIITSQSTKCVN